MPVTIPSLGLVHWYPDDILVEVGYDDGIHSQQYLRVSLPPECSDTTQSFLTCRESQRAVAYHPRQG